MMSGISSMRLLDRLDAVGRFGDAEPGELQVGGVHLARVLVVLDDEHERLSLVGRVISSPPRAAPEGAA